MKTRDRSEGRVVWWAMVAAAAIGFAAGNALPPKPSAVADSVANSNQSMIAVTGRVAGGADVLFLVDTEKRKLALYDPEGGKGFRLAAIRDIQWDLKGYDWRNPSGGVGPPVKDIEAIVKKAEKKPEPKKPGGND